MGKEPKIGHDHIISRIFDLLIAISFHCTYTELSYMNHTQGNKCVLAQNHQYATYVVGLASPKQLGISGRRIRKN